MALPLNGRLLRVFLFFPFLSALPILCKGQDVVCSAGFGSFDASSTTGVALSVGAIKQTGLAQRTCQAKLSWDNRDLLLVPEAWLVDVDLMEADLGFRTPVVALQIKQADVDPLMRYEIYSLAKPPRKLRTITGGDFFRAADTNLDGQIEIWTHDAGAVNGFEGIPLSAFDFPPAIALRFEQQRLIDVSSEFPSHFDSQIATVRAQLDSNDMNKFKNSDGKLSSLSHLSWNELHSEQHSLMSTKVEVLEIVWSYLYSGREQEAWRSLADMWPSSDFDRIRTGILDARARGIRAEVEGVSSGAAPARRRKRVMIYDNLTENIGKAQILPAAVGQTDEKEFMIDARPQPILLIRAPPPDDVPAASLNREAVVDMVIDSAGKVWSIKTVGEPNKDLIDASAEWKFVPALKDGHPVASRLRLGVTPFQ
jgi:hypothetical protein